MVQLDQIDKEILVALLKDSRTKFTDIARKCHVSKYIIKKRYNKLVKSGVIKKSTLIINPKKMGYLGHLSLYVKVKFNKEKTFIEYVIKKKGTTAYHVKLNENYNVHVLIPVKDMDELEQKKQQIINHSTVISFKANIWTNIECFPENLETFYA